MKTLTATAIPKISPTYPSLLAERLGESAHSELFVIGNESILQQSLVALICSVKCPGSIVIKTFDVVRELRDHGVTVVGGFHSPMEQDCFKFLLRGKQPVLMSPAKGLGGLRLSPAQQRAIEENRLTLISVFPETVTRTNKKQSQTRSEFIAALATSIFIPHASSGGNAESIGYRAVGWQQTLFTFEDNENNEMFCCGARTYELERLKGKLQSPKSLPINNSRVSDRFVPDR